MSLHLPLSISRDLFLLGLAAVGAVILVKTSAAMGRCEGLVEGQAAGYARAARECDSEKRIIYLRGKLAGLSQAD